MCNVLYVAILSVGIWGENIFLEDENWKEAYRTTGKLWMNADKVETRYFMQDENQWSTLYRLSEFMSSPQHDDSSNWPVCKSSMIQQQIDIAWQELDKHSWVSITDTSRKTITEHKEVIGFPGEQTHDPDLIAVQCEYLHWWFFTAEAKTVWKKLAVSIHMRCWNLAICVLGPVVETHLDIFTALALRKVKEWKPDYDEYTEDPTGSTGMSM